MITADITKTEFVVQILERDLKNIANVQLTIAEKNLYLSGQSLTAKKGRREKIGRRSGELLRSLQSPDYMIQSKPGGFIVTSNIVTYLRFLDMKKLGNRHIYNRQVWGILYHNALPDISYRYGEAIRDNVGEALQTAFNQFSKK